ncbi:MAG: ASCH domain-containing protein [Candidatus Methanomethylicia archaeon]
MVGGKVLRFKGRFKEDILSGRKTTTIRKYSKLKPGEVVKIEVGGEIIGKAEIKKIIRKEFRDLTVKDALNDGFKSLHELKKTLCLLYGKICENESLYIIEFKLIRN